MAQFVGGNHFFEIAQSVREILNPHQCSTLDKSIVLYLPVLLELTVKTEIVSSSSSTAPLAAAGVYIRYSNYNATLNSQP